MTRDDSSGGWVPLGGGGLSNVSVRKKIPEKSEYLIQGRMISDQSVSSTHFQFAELDLNYTIFFGSC